MPSPSSENAKAVYFSKGIGKIQILPSILPEFTRLKKVRFYQNYSCTAALGWGLKPSADKARKHALKYNIPYIALEDGFLRSLDLGVNGFQPHSLAVDKAGIYYDATRVNGSLLLIRPGVSLCG